MQMVRAFARTFGRHLVEDHFEFPCLSDIVRHPSFTVESMQMLGFGYRSTFLYRSLSTLQRLEERFQMASETASQDCVDIPGVALEVLKYLKPQTESDSSERVDLSPDVTTEQVRATSSLLDAFQNATRKELSLSLVKRFLQQCFFGIGPKIADCICLYGFRFFSAVPLDVRMFKLLCEGEMAEELFERREIRKRRRVAIRDYEATQEAFLSAFGRDVAGLLQLFLYTEVSHRSERMQQKAIEVPVHEFKRD
eukprot:Protomagalhaensia_sp_Gyna_25__3892@NODE_349_length_3779_cov_88_325401_g269_i0_p2_GENE_NODE_349_length_3779_cov_88_325401_g269_i0NODE_349_length_3779_cov_88_325401_g269_i0_p2_ORF_typecomplete_len252_score31_92HhHGPD/PF00730_25/3_9e06_NODE_349_length_3779_cov_88_325401_g269_i010931848